MTTYFVIHVKNDGFGSGDEPEVLGPFESDSAQCDAAEKVRDEVLAPHDRLYWLDIDPAGAPEVGAFDPRFFDKEVQ